LAKKNREKKKGLGKRPLPPPPSAAAAAAPKQVVRSLETNTYPYSSTAKDCDIAEKGEEA
jgi:hypothetical protein